MCRCREQEIASVCYSPLSLVIMGSVSVCIVLTSFFLSVSAGLLCDLLWADPDKETMGWGENDRGVSFTFGPEIVSKFLVKHDLDLICRAHQVQYCTSSRR